MSEQEMAQQIAMEEMAKSVTATKDAEKQEQLKAVLAERDKVAEVCSSLGLSVTVQGTWVIVKDGKKVTTKSVSKILGKDGMKLRWMNNKKYWAYVAKLPDGFYWDNKDKEIKERGEE